MLRGLTVAKEELCGSQALRKCKSESKLALRHELHGRYVEAVIRWT